MPMRSTGIFLAGVLAGAGAWAVTANLFQQSEPTQAAALTTAHTSKLSVAHQPRQKDDTSARDCRMPVRQEAKCGGNTVVHSRPQGGPGGERDVSEPQPGAEWNALVGGMLEWEVARHTGQKLTAEKKERLISELSRLRESSLALQQSPSEPDDPAELRDRLTQTLALVQVDQVFRKELGLGVAEFLRGLDSSAIEDVSPAPAEP
jgi:hypothetical protein